MTDGLPTVPGLPMTRGRCPFDPAPELGVLRAGHPVARMEFPDGHVGWLVTGYPQVRRLLADRRLSSRGDALRSPIPLPMATERTEPAPGMFTAMDPPEHTRYRRAVAAWFSARRTRTLEPRLAELAGSHLDAMAGGKGEGPVDLVAGFAEPMAASAICELLGVPLSQRPAFARAIKALFAVHSSAEDAIAGWHTITGLLRALVEAKRAEPADDLLATLVTEGRLTDEELVTVGSVLLTAGYDTSANMIALGTFALLEHPEQAAALAADTSLAERAVEELLRYLTVVHAGGIRAAGEDLEFEGHRMAAGDAVSLSFAAANRDPSLCARPDALDVTREPVPHLAFGHGVHQCVGQQLARLELRVAFEALFGRFPGLRLGIPAAEVRTRPDMIIYGVHELPVTW
ncbi:cytochrome [Streptomyces sp. CB00455]|uniref:cytochrome P450 n=1 Tax=Streptomyces sp. CB00455 TaxID=1703927 RepID=UPI00093AF3DF|nr:cytochrome P450 [Streptomyces sp. CB00455]OKK15629.1 cytochrome [Streptomyces sp. CB00455]